LCLSACSMEMWRGMVDDFVHFDKADIEKSIPEIFERQVTVGPRRIALATQLQSFSYDDLNRWSNRIARSILRILGDREEPVALLLHQSAEAVATTLGTLKAGKIYVPLEPSQSEGELKNVIADCEPRLIVSDTKHAPLARRLIGAQGLCLNVEETTDDEIDDSPSLQFLPDRVCYIFYTSGTTGPPKGVFDNHRNVLHNVMRYTNTLGIRATDRLSLIESISYSGTVSSLFTALLNGATLCPFDVRSQGIERMAGWVDDQSISVFHSVPTIFEQLLAKRSRFENVRIVRLEGDRAEPRHIALFQEHFCGDRLLVNGLGTTETGIVRQFFVRPTDGVDGAVVPIGQAVEDMDIILIDDAGRAAEPRGVGEIIVQSAYLACGYWNRSDLTAAKFTSEPTWGGSRAYRTGDLGRMRADGLLEYLGRKDFQVKLRGQWIETAEIENALTGLGSIDQALVMTRDDGMGTQQLVAYLLALGEPPSIDTLRQRLGQSLPAIMVPSRFVFLERFPEDRNGKVDRRALPVPGRMRPALAQDFVAPRTSVERTVADCFRQVLRLDQVGINDDFLDLGGDSLLATELLMILDTRLGISCSAALISQSFSVTSIIDRLHQALSESAIVLLQAGDGRAPLFCIHNYEGHVLEYYRLVHCLGPDQTVYGVQSRAYTRSAILDSSVESMAAAYVKEITSLGITGPYHLSGNCFGGMVAYEMACQLRQQGHEVALLALIDTQFPPGLLRRLAVKIARPQRWKRLLRLPASQWPWFLLNRAYRAARMLPLEILGSVRQGSKPARSDRSEGAGPEQRVVLAQNKAAMANYKPASYGGAMVLICIGPPSDQRGWMRMAKRGCRVIEVPNEAPLDTTSAPHLTATPYVTSLAEHITKLLTKFE
jgi:amino acid adenylation domain-containing protein